MAQVGNTKPPTLPNWLGVGWRRIWDRCSALARDERRASLLALLLLLAVAAVLRSGALFDDRTWGDEDLTLTQAAGFESWAPLPTVFRRSQLHLDRSLPATLTRIARTQPYPPATTLLVMLVRDTPDPILAARLLLGLLGLSVIPIVFFATRALAGSRTALVAAAYVALSSPLTTSAQQVKWYASAMFLATVAGVLLHRISFDERDPRCLWLGYAASLALLAHVHYFGGWILPGHGLVIMTTMRRRRLWQMAALATFVAVCCLPWYAFGAASQAHFARDYFAQLQAASGAFTPDGFAAWTAPLNGRTWLAATAYAAATCLGCMPSLWRTRDVLPIVLLGALFVGRALTSRNPAVRRFAMIACGPLVFAVVGQTLMAWRLGHVVPLTAQYLVLWIPLVMVTVVLGARELYSRGVATRTLVATGMGLCLVLAGFTVAHTHYPTVIRQEGRLCRLREVARLLQEFESDGAAFVFRSDDDAKLLGLFYRGDGLQVVAPAQLPPLPTHIRSLFLVMPDGTISPQRWPGWTNRGAVRSLGCTRVVEFARDETPDAKDSRTGMWLKEVSARDEPGVPRRRELLLVDELVLSQPARQNRARRLAHDALRRRSEQGVVEHAASVSAEHDHVDRLLLGVANDLGRRFALDHDLARGDAALAGLCRSLSQLSARVGRDLVQDLGHRHREQVAGVAHGQRLDDVQQHQLCLVLARKGNAVG
jgi:hypothetical protein